MTNTTNFRDEDSDIHDQVQTAVESGQKNPAIKTVDPKVEQNFGSVDAPEGRD